MEGFRQHGDSEIANIIRVAYQRLPSTKQPSWNSSNIIAFQTIYPLEQKLDGRKQSDRLPEMLKSFHFDVKEGPALNSHLGILQTSSSSKPCVLLSRNTMRGTRQNMFRMAWTVLFRYQRRACTNYSSWNSSNNIICDNMFLTVLSVVWDCGNSWSYPLVFRRGWLGQGNRWAV